MISLKNKKINKDEGINPLSCFRTRMYDVASAFASAVASAVASAGDVESVLCRSSF